WQTTLIGGVTTHFRPGLLRRLWRLPSISPLSPSSSPRSARHSSAFPKSQF
ncbi:hypothetical protein FRC02_006431, partial [Tulasnella sp. 418]